MAAVTMERAPVVPSQSGRMMAAPDCKAAVMHATPCVQQACMHVNARMAYKRKACAIEAKQFDAGGHLFQTGQCLLVPECQYLPQLTPLSH